MSWLEKTPSGTLLRIQVQPKASKTEVTGVHGDRLKIRIAAPPVDGAANEELLRFLKKKLGVPASQITLLRGHTSKMKDVLCVGVTEDAIQALTRKPISRSS